MDDVYPQTQHWATVGSTGWSTAIQRLRSQWVAHGFDPHGLLIQLTLGDRDNGLPSSSAVARFREAVSQGVGRLFLWWNPAVLEDMAKLLETLDS